MFGERLLKLTIHLLCIYLFLICFISTFSLQFGATEELETAKTEVLQVKKIDHVTKTLLIDSNFDSAERMFILLATQSWSKATSNIVEFKFILLPSPKVSEDILADDNTLYIVKATESYPEIMALEVNHVDDEGDDFEILGYYEADTVIKSILVISSRLDDLNYQSVIMHELGHALGLKHNRSDSNGLMFPAVSTLPARIGKSDIKQFCTMYNCHSLKEEE